MLNIFVVCGLFWYFKKGISLIEWFNFRNLLSDFALSVWFFEKVKFLLSYI